MLITVVIPVYNTKDYLNDCVLSVLNTDFNDFEILLIDDGSTDGECAQLCDNLAITYPDIIRVIHQENKGLGGARNTGIQNANGEYLLLLDSDDTLTPDALNKLSSVLLKDKPDIISFNIYSDDGNGNKTPVFANYIHSDKPFMLSEEKKFMISLPSAACRVWKRSLYIDNNIEYPNKVWYEDIRTTTKLFACAKSITTIKDHLYNYLQRADSIMHDQKIDRNSEIIDAFKDIVSWFKEHNYFEEYKDVLCRLAIDNLYIAASVRVLMADTKHPLLKRFSSYMYENFPDFKDNKYLCELTRARKLAFKLLLGKHYKILNILFKIYK